MAEMTTTVLASLINPEAIMEARLAFQQNVNLVREVRVGDLTNENTAVASFPSYSAITVTKPGSETTDVTTNQTATPTDTTLTVARRTVRLDPSDLAQASAIENMSVRLGMLIGQARAKQVDTDILGVMGTAHTSSAGATNSTDVAISDLLAALLILEGNEANQNLILALHPKQWNHIRGDLVLSSAVTTSDGPTDPSAQAQSVMNSGLLNVPLLGARALVTPRVGTGADTNDMYLGILGRFDESIGYGVKNVNARLGLPEIEMERNASVGATEFVHNYYDTAGIIRTDGLVLVKSQTY